MPNRNVHISAKQHGAPVPTKPALCSPLPFCLFSLALCLAAVSGLPACLPCPPACRCLHWDSSCTVNCSKAGLPQAPGMMDLPPNTTVLDLSYNGIISIDDNLLDNLTSLEKLYLQGNNISSLFKEIFAGRRCLSDIDISNNQISTLEDGIFADLFNLSKINLSFNEFVCDCNLSWLPAWMSEEEANGVIIVDSEFIKCAKPSKLKDVSVLNVNFSSLLYGSEFAACSPDRQSLVNLSLVSNWISSRENCTALCFIEGERYAALDNESHCLCGSELAPDSDAICIQEEIDREFIQVCGCTIIEQAFEVTVANFADLRTFSLFEAARLTVKTLINISTFQWDFGDLSPPFNTTSHVVFHKYGLPGTYLVSVAFCVGSKPTSLHVEIHVAIPPGRLEVHCPPVVQTNKSIDAKIQNWNSNSVTASWSITTSSNGTIKDAPFCTLGGYQSNNHCYRLVTNNSTWQMARHFCQSHSDGDLAIIKSPEIQNFIANITGCEHPVWIGLSDTAGAGTLQWVDGSTLENFQEWLPGQPNTLLSNTCVLMGANLAGEWKTDLCTTRRNFVCEYRVGEKIPGANYNLLGSPAFSTHLPVKNITVNYNSSTPSELVELMVFPGLWFNHNGFVSVLELATQNLNQTIQVKFKIYRPKCAGKDMQLVTPDNEEVCSSFAFCLPRTLSNTTHGCNSDTKWCSLAETCLPLKRPCGTDVFIRCPNLLPPHFIESHPLYDLVKEVPCTVPANSSTHYVLLLRNERIEVQSNDIIAIQHDGKPGSFLQCQQNDSSPWQQSYYSVVYSGESKDLWINLTDSNRTDGTVCNLRVLYTHRQETNASSPLLRNGQQSPGVYTYQVMMESGPFSSNASCTVQVLAPITDFSVIYPLKQNGVFYVPKNRAVIIVKVQSSGKALTSWSGSNQNFSCEMTCPSELSSNCEKDGNTCFSRIPLTVKDCNLTSITITAKNKVSSVNKMVTVRAEDPVEGLTILPDPSIRVLSNSLVTYTARVSSGTNVMFKWTVDDKASFIHYNQVYKVIYRTEAVYQLSLIASNHVSSQKIICNVTVDRRNPLAEFNVSAVPAILVRGFLYTFAASVKVDAAVNATFRWSFGDGSGDQVYQFTCPYNLSLSVPQLTVKQAVLQQNVTHVYQKPGTSSHVGISLYGREDKSGHRHLDREDAFHRNSVNIFQIATDNSLGNIWKIRVWHDNKGLTPSWYLQHVIIKDLQTNNSYYFLVNDWLAVDNERNEGLVEKEVLAATEAKLKDFSRIFTGEIQRGFSEGHIWLSIWDRPPRSCFTRVQRVTCCLVLIFLFFCASAVWYGIISDGSKSDVPVSTLVPLSGESVAAGIVSSIIIYPLYLIIILLFRKAQSRVAMHDPGQHESNVLEIDDYIDSSTAGSSFLTFADNMEEDYKEKLKSDIIANSMPNWPAYDSMMNWPDLLNDQPIIGSNIPKLRRGRGTRHLGIETQLSSDDEPLSLGIDQVRNKYFSASDEHLIQRINFDGNNEVSTSYDSGRISLDAESHLISNLTEIIDGSKQPRAEAPILDQISDNGRIIRPHQGIARSAMTRRIAFTDPPQQCLFPFWCSYTAHVLCLVLFSGCFTVSIWIGINFTSSIALMWLISGIFSVLSSFFLLEPLKVLTEALYFAVVAKRIHPDEDDNLVAKPRVEQTSEKISKVRPPQGYGLLQAKEEARKVQILHRMLKNFIIYMLFLLVVLLINYGDSFRDAQSRLLHSSIRQGLLGPRKGVEFQKIKRSEELWKWMAEVLLPYLYNNRSRTLLGCPRIRQIRSKVNNVQCLQQLPSLPITTQCLQDTRLHDNSDHEAGWKSPVTNLSDTWSYSSPDLPGVWYWGQNALYDSGGYIQKLGRTRDQSNYTLWNLQERNWLDGKTRAIFIEFTQYFQNVDLYSVVTLLMEFPFSGGATTIIDIKPFSLLQLSTGVDFLLIMMIFLMLFILYFTVTELLLISHRGKSYFLQFWNYLQWCIIILSICCVVVHLKRARIGDKQWAIYRSNPDSFTNFYQMAYLSYVFTSVTAILLFLLTVKAARQLRFIRKWSIFGKTLYNSAKELMAVGATLVGLVLAYAQIGYLVFSANLDNFKTVGGSILSLFAVIEKGVCFKQCLFEYPNLCYIYYTSYVTIEVGIILQLFAVVLIQNYKIMKSEMYRPAVEPQDHELVELFVKRLKMWIGISKEKEFRHKVKFEGMVSLPSRSSRDSKSTCLHTASTISDISSSSISSVSVPVDTFPVVSPNKVAQIEINIHRLVPLFETLLEQFDRVNMATEDVYQIECKLRNAQDRMHQKKINKKAEELFAAYSRIRVRRRGDNLHSSLWNSRGNTKTNNTQDGQQLGNIPLAEDSTKQALRGKGPHPPRRKCKTSDKKWQRRASGDQMPESSE
ncbi:polycystin-1 [Rhincodon typus]|uniref:polycystin-1 n=1 Tax=Rhincodon typus TaxID=259920 RepID=UPI002030830A|nr:polycystin-1 [Rhincodon typus]